MTPRRPTDDELLDARLRVAAAPLADEPLPDGTLEAADASALRWQRAAPLVLAAASGVLAVAVGIGLVQVGPPAVSDASASPSNSSTPEPIESAAPSTTPSPTPEPTPEPLAAYLVSAGSACGDGTAGFDFMVPDGWFANRTAPACRHLSDTPFDATVADPESRIALLVRLEPTPVGDATEVDSDVTTETADRFATRYSVERAGATYVVFVVPLIATIDGSSAYLHVEADASDAEAVATLEAVVERLAVREPLTLPDEAIAEADALYAEPEVDGCINVELGFATAFPESWWTNTPVEGVPGCSYLAPTSFEIPDDPSQVPDGVAITIRIVEGDVGSFDEVTGYETFVVDRWPAVRSELAGSTYRVLVQLGEVEEFGPNLVLTTGADPLHRAVLDRLLETLHVSPPPSEVVEREPLRSCGQEVVTRLAEGDVRDGAARDCFWDAYEAGEQAEFISLGVTVEGARILDIWRVIGPSEVELYADATHDNAGSLAWELHRCTSLDGERSEDDEVIYFGLGACDTPIQLESAPQG